MSSFSYDYGTLNIEPSNIPSTPARRTSQLYNSASKLQDFFGVHDIEELKSNTAHPRPHRLKSIFTIHTNGSNKQSQKEKRQSKKLQRTLNKLRKEKKPTKCKLLRKLTHTKSAPVPNTKNQTKIMWRPNLEMICKDCVLLDALTQFMELSYNSENILFLRAVHALKRMTVDSDLIDSKIVSIYDSYVVPYSAHQINLSYPCLMSAMSKRETFATLDIDAKRALFDLCVEQIEHLVITSVLGSFYVSSLFQSKAKKSKYYTTDSHRKYFHKNYPSNSSSSSPYSSLSTPPIKIESSLSAESFFEFDA